VIAVVGFRFIFGGMAGAKGKFRETVFLESTPRIDEEQGILYGVKLLGEHSKNGRRYLPEAMRAAVPLYEGSKSFADHPERNKLGEDRRMKDWIGV